MKLSDLPNIGKALEEQLNRAGINTPEELKALGVREAFLRLRLQEPDACVNRLYALAGAMENVRWHDLPQGTRDELKEWFHSQG